MSPAEYAFYCGPSETELAQIPDDLKALPQWVLFQLLEVISKKTGELKLDKPPINPATLRKASTTNPKTWGAYARALAALPRARAAWERTPPPGYRGAGLGFVLTAADDYLLVDMDHSIDASGVIAPWAQDILTTLHSYSQVSVSGRGLHTILTARMPPGGNQQGDLQAWDRERFIAMTGRHVPHTPATIEARQAQWTMVHTACILQPKADAKAAKQPSKRAPRVTPSRPPRLSNAEILTKAHAANNSTKFARLWAGDWSGYAYPSQSEADEALCCLLAFWTRDAEQIDSLFRESGLYRDKWWDRADYREDTIAKALDQVTAQYDPVAYAAEHAPRQRRNGTTPGPEPAEAPAEAGPSLGWNDYTNACALVRDHGPDLRYCYPWKSWLVWTGTHWAKDTSGAIMRMAKATIKRLARQVETLEDDKAKALMAHIKKSLSTAALKALVENAQSEPGIAVQPDALDTHPWLLNCANGTLDLQTGLLRPHDRADLLTRCLTVAYDPQATCPTWERFLRRIMGGTQGEDSPDMSVGELEHRRVADERAQALIGFVQRALGYALTGETREQCLFIFWGSGANGKSTLVNTWLALLGPYAMKATAELLMVTRNDRHPTERADLCGTRCVAAIETEAGGRLNEVFVKEATGGDPIRARHMREDFWQFDPTHKVVLATNHKPVILGTDRAIWRRIKLVPFTVAIPDPEQDKQLPATLAGELPGILAWAMRGCLAWQQDGLGEPDAVTEATAGYRQEMDVFEGFLAEECYTLPSAHVHASTLYEAYERWCQANDVAALTKRAFGLRLSDSGFIPDKGTAGVRIWKGIGLPAKEEDNKRSGVFS